MIIFIKILYGIAIAWNVVRTIVYMIFAWNVEQDMDPNNVELRMDLLWAILHAICVVALICAWSVL